MYCTMNQPMSVDVNYIVKTRIWILIVFFINTASFDGINAFNKSN